MDTPTNGPTSGSATNGAPLNFIRDGDVVTLVDAKGGAAAYILHIGVRTNASDVRRLALEAQPDPRPHPVETCPCEICKTVREGAWKEEWGTRLAGQITTALEDAGIRVVAALAALVKSLREVVR
jgi:hypothetical protein